MSDLYPTKDSYRASFLPVDHSHKLYFEEYGNPDGLPVIFLHGGPGSGCSSWQRQLFDPERFRVVFLDQRGAGRSEPAGCLENNTTQALVADLESLREELGIERWALFGGSWGATLALVYAQQYPRRVTAMVLRGIFLARRRDAGWFFGPDGVARLFPKQYEQFLAPLNDSERGDPVPAYYKRLTGEDENLRHAAARAWGDWEGFIACYNLPPEKDSAPPDPAETLRRARIVSHYTAHDFFLGPEGALGEVEKIQAIPGAIIHGRRDLVCPLESAWTLHRAWPRAALTLVKDGGHVASQASMTAALLRSLKELADRLGARAPIMD